MRYPNCSGHWKLASTFTRLVAIRSPCLPRTCFLHVYSGEHSFYMLPHLQLESTEQPKIPILAFWFQSAYNLSQDEFEFNLACLTNSQRYLRNSPASITEIVCEAYFHWQAVLSLFLKQGLVSNSSGSVKRRDNTPPRIKCRCRKGTKYQLMQLPQSTKWAGMGPLAFPLSHAVGR